MSQFGEYFYNLKNALFSVNPSIYRGSDIHFLGSNDKYIANQHDKRQPIEDGFIRSSDVYSIVNKIAKNAKTVPRKVEIVDGDDREEVTSGRLFDLVHEPNKLQSGEDQTEEAIIDLLIGGNGYISTMKSVGMGDLPAQVNQLRPQLVEIKARRVGKFIEATGYVYRIDGEKIHVKLEDVTHFKYCNPSIHGIMSVEGLSPLVAGYLTIQGLTNNQVASTAIYNNRGKGGIITAKNSEFPLVPKEVEAQQAIWDRNFNGAEKTGGIHQSATAVEYIRLDMDPSTMKLIEGKVLSMRDLCNIYDVQSTLFNDPSNRIQNNVEPSGSMFWTNAVKPNLRKYDAAYDRAVVRKFSKADFKGGKKKYEVTSDFSGVEALQKDKKAEAEKDKLMMEGIQIILGYSIDTESKKTLIKENYDVSDEFVNGLTEIKQENNS